MQRFIVLFSLVFFAPLVSWAVELSVTEVSEPYQVIPMVGEPTERQLYLGELDNFPIMYELAMDESFTITAQVRQIRQSAGEPKQLSLIIVRKDDRGGGVTEVARLYPKTDKWTVRKDSVYGLTYWESDVVQEEVEKGVYRIEVSTPDNLGQYQLVIGEGDDTGGYFETLGYIRTTQEFFGYGVSHLLLSSYVYYPLGIIILLFIIHRTWKYRKVLTHDT